MESKDLQISIFDYLSNVGSLQKKRKKRGKCFEEKKRTILEGPKNGCIHAWGLKKEVKRKSQTKKVFSKKK